MAEDPSLPMHGSCECGACTFDVAGVPKSRLKCHCTICQAFTGREYSDVVIVPAWRAELVGYHNATFRFFKKSHWPPPNLNRGECNTCRRPVVEIWGRGLMKLLFLPVANFDKKSLLPQPSGHLFYEHHVREHHDCLPKHSGYFDSEGALAKMIMRSF